MIYSRIGMSSQVVLEIFAVALRWDFGNFNGTLGTSGTSGTYFLVDVRT